MSWQSFIDKSVGDKKVFTDNEVRELLLSALKYEAVLDVIFKLFLETNRVDRDTFYRALKDF